jgi:hypothetical protein
MSFFSKSIKLYVCRFKNPFILSDKVESILGKHQKEYLKLLKSGSFIVLFKYKVKVESILGKHQHLAEEYAVLQRYKHFFF